MRVSDPALVMLFLGTMILFSVLSSGANDHPPSDDSDEIEKIIELSTQQQEREREARATARQAARVQREKEPQRKTMPKPGDLNSMLAWAIENSDPEKLKEMGHQADLARQSGEEPARGLDTLPDAFGDEASLPVQESLEAAASEAADREASVQERKEKFEAKIQDVPDVMDTLFKSESNKMQVPIDTIVNATVNATVPGNVVPGTQAVLEALEQLELHVEDIDKANDVSAMGGLPALIALVQSADAELAALATSVLGQMASNNLRAQKELLAVDALRILLAQVQNASSSHQSKLLYALGTAMRNYPDAVAQGYQLGGAPLFAGLIRSGTVKVQKRAVSLLGDLADQSQDWKAWLSQEVRSTKGKLLLRMLQLEDEELHEKALLVLMGLLREESSDELVSTWRSPLEDYVARSTQVNAEDGGFAGPMLAAVILQGRGAAMAHARDARGEL